jgi:hypothetical protein
MDKGQLLPRAALCLFYVLALGPCVKTQGGVGLDQTNLPAHAAPERWGGIVDCNTRFLRN